jgi:hypothetical protein
LLFAPYAAEAMAIPAIDEFLDVADGRRIFWRRPQRDVHRLACELHRLSETSAREDTPALQEEFLEVLSRLREPADHIAEWIGTLFDGRFRPRPDRFADETPFLRQGFDLASDPARFAEAYGTPVSVNVSLAARSMKRRMLGLDVTRPGEGSRAERYRPRTIERMPMT